MYIAYVKIENRIVSVKIEDYKKYKVKGYLAHCFTCDNVLKTRAESSLTKTHFAHEKGALCPTISDNRTRFLNYKFKEYNKLKKELIIGQVKQNLSNIYNYCLFLCDKALLYSEFNELLQIASQKRVWEYSNLSIHHIPYSLLTLRLKFTKRQNKYRKQNIFFWFKEANYQDEVLWIDYTNPLLLQKYDADSCNIIQEIQITDGFLLDDFLNKESFSKWIDTFYSSIR